MLPLDHSLQPILLMVLLNICYFIIIIIYICPNGLKEQFIQNICLNIFTVGCQFFLHLLKTVHRLLWELFFFPSVLPSTLTEKNNHHPGDVLTKCHGEPSNPLYPIQHTWYVIIMMSFLITSI